jgi:hypothetical protein
MTFYFIAGVFLAASALIITAVALVQSAEVRS